MTSSKLGVVEAQHGGVKGVMFSSCRSVIAYLPSQVDIDDLYPENGKLVSEKEIQRLQEMKLADGRYSKSELDTKYTLIVQDGKYFAVFPGKKKLGDGSNSRVKLVQDLKTGEWLALKVQPPVLSQDGLITAKNELEQLVNADQVIKVGAKPVAFERYSKSKNRNQHYMLIKLGKGEDLFDFVMSGVNAPCITWIRLAQKVLQAANVLHENNILHRDIKLENIRYEHATGELLFVDFGYAISLDKNGEFKIDQHCGTHNYVAPEILNSDGEITYNKKVDVYSLGVILGAIFDLIYVNSETDRVELVDEFSEEFKNNKRIPDEDLRKEILFFIANMLNDDPAKRPSTQEALDYFIKLENKLNDYDKTKKIALLSVDAFNLLKKNNDDRKNELIKLKDFHEVWLMDSSKSDDPLYYIKIRRELESDGVNVGRSLFHGMSCAELVANIPIYIAKEDPNCIHQFTDVDKILSNILLSFFGFSKKNLFQTVQNKEINGIVSSESSSPETAKMDEELPGMSGFVNLSHQIERFFLNMFMRSGVTFGLFPKSTVDQKKDNDSQVQIKGLGPEVEDAMGKNLPT